MIDALYSRLAAQLKSHTGIGRVDWREYAGQRFLYITGSLAANELLAVIQQTGEHLASGTRLRVQCNHVRSDARHEVFRFRFLVPEEKMFCCGNQCTDCVLHRK